MDAIKPKETMHKEVINDLKKTGFASEMQAMKAFISQNWKTSGNRCYFDLDENKTCEIDLYAYHVLMEKSGEDITTQSFFNVIAEVKKTDKPWVVFRENSQRNWRLQEGWTSVIYCDGLSDSRDQANLTQILLSSGLGIELGWFGYGIHEAFKSPDKSSSWYQALVKASKAAEDVLKANSKIEKNIHIYFLLSH